MVFVILIMNSERPPRRYRGQAGRSHPALPSDILSSAGLSPNGSLRFDAPGPNQTPAVSSNWFAASLNLSQCFGPHRQTAQLADSPNSARLQSSSFSLPRFCQSFGWDRPSNAFPGLSAKDSALITVLG